MKEDNENNKTLFERPIKISEQKPQKDILPFVSICCITYNHENYIRDAIEGFLMQETTFPVEILINDDASTDLTANVVREYQNKYPLLIKPIYQEENLFSKGIRAIYSIYMFPKAQGKYIAMCDGDDYWTDPLKLQKQVDILERYDDCGLVYTSTYFYFQNKNQFRKRIPKQNLYDGNALDVLLTKTNPIQTSTVCFRKFLLSKFDYSDVKKQKLFNGDIILWLTLSKYCKFFHLTDITTVYRVHSSLANGKLSTTINLIRNSYIARISFYLSNRNELHLKKSVPLILLARKYFFIVRRTIGYYIPFRFTFDR